RDRGVRCGGANRRLPLGRGAGPGPPMPFSPALIERRYGFDRARITRRPIQIIPTIPTAHGARKAIATPIMRKLHMIAPALCANVRLRVAINPLSCETILPWL